MTKNTLILYMTQHGATKRVAELIKQNLTGEVTLCDLRKQKPALKDYDRVVLGGSIHAGKVQKRMLKFMQKKQDELLSKELGIFLSCMHAGETAENQFNENFPEPLRKHAKATSIVGGAFDFNQMNFMEKAIVKKVANVTGSVNNIDTEEIKKFVTTMNNSAS